MRTYGASQHCWEERQQTLYTHMGHNGRSCSSRAWTNKGAHTNSAVMPRHLPFFQNNWPLRFSTWWNSRCTFMCNNVHEVNSHLSTSAITNICQSYQNVNRLESEVTFNSEWQTIPLIPFSRMCIHKYKQARNAIHVLTIGSNTKKMIRFGCVGVDWGPSVL